MLEAWSLAYQAGQTPVSGEILDELHTADVSALAELLAYIERCPPGDSSQETFLAETLVALRQRTKRFAASDYWQELVPHVAKTYQTLHGRWSANYQFLAWLADMGGEAAMEAFLRLWLELPPNNSCQVALACQPLLHVGRRADLARLFPDLLRGLGHLPSAAVILDLANFAYRNRVFDRHPAAQAHPPALEVLRPAVEYMASLNEAELQNLAIAQRRTLVNDLASALVSFCHAAALIGDRQYVDLLRTALRIRHRRVHLEAAYALATMADQRGREALLDLAADPAVRLGVLAYADELGLLDEVPPQYQTEWARAESQLAMWLADQSQMGMAPHQLRLVEARRMYWPGYSEPVVCYLIEYTYHFERGEYKNLGIVGPLTYAFAADLTELNTDDVFALFAGWSAEHEDIFETDIARLSDRSRQDAERLAAKLQREGFQQVEPIRLGFFFGQRALVARARREDRSGVVVVDDETVQWWPMRSDRWNLGPTEAFAIYKGRRLLAAFNPDGRAEPAEDEQPELTKQSAASEDSVGSTNGSSA
jgi:hypothetical protein